MYRSQECARGVIGFWQWQQYMEAMESEVENRLFSLKGIPGGKEAIAVRELQFIDMIATENEVSEFRQ